MVTPWSIANFHYVCMWWINIWRRQKLYFGRASTNVTELSFRSRKKDNHRQTYLITLHSNQENCPYHSWQGNTFTFACEVGSLTANESVGKPTIRLSNGAGDLMLTFLWANESEELCWVDSIDGGGGTVVAHMKGLWSAIVVVWR